MKLIRFAVLMLRTDNEINPIQADVSGVKLTVKKVKINGETRSSFLVESEAQLDAYPEINDNNELVIDKNIREKCEFGINVISNLLSVFNACQKSIFSPYPCAAIEHKDNKEKEYLKSSNGIQVVARRDNGSNQPIDFNPEYVSLLTDRLDGIFVLSEHYSSSESGKYRELVRFFELAFNLPFVQIEKKLFQFLKNTPYGYERDEIRRWISHRHPMMHADQRKSQSISFTSDIQSYLLRMEQAAIEVLFNKTYWHSSSTIRRSEWRPTAFSYTPEGKMIVLQGSELRALFRIYDEFGVFPKLLSSSMNNLKENWYYEFKHPEILESFT